MTDCKHSKLVKRTPIPGPTSGQMYFCEDCGDPFRVAPWGEVNVTLGDSRAVDEAARSGVAADQV
jgi:hypothetical protein